MKALARLAGFDIPDREAAKLYTKELRDQGFPGLADDEGEVATSAKKEAKHV